jgi:hypothetical protein
MILVPRVLDPGSPDRSERETLGGVLDSAGEMLPVVCTAFSDDSLPSMKSISQAAEIEVVLLLQLRDDARSLQQFSSAQPLLPVRFRKLAKLIPFPEPTFAL